MGEEWKFGRKEECFIVDDDDVVIISFWSGEMKGKEERKKRKILTLVRAMMDCLKRF